MNKLGLIALASAMVGAAHAQSIYIPNQPIKDQSVSLKGWGSGTIAETDEVASEGSFSLRVTTRNYFQGGIINFGKPIDLSGAFGDGNNLLKFAIRSSGEKPKFATTVGGAGAGGGPSAGGAGAGGAGGGGGNRGGGGGAGGFDGGGAGQVELYDELVGEFKGPKCPVRCPARPRSGSCHAHPAPANA